jgi:hypothetical protein
MMPLVYLETTIPSYYRDDRLGRKPMKADSPIVEEVRRRRMEIS